MKKLLLASLTAAALFCSSTAQAIENPYVVYNNGTINSELHYYEWWQAAVNYTAANPDGTGSVLEFKSSTGGASASCGWNMEAPQNTGYLHNATLTFKWYATTVGAKYTIRLKGTTEQNQSFTVTDENVNQWNTVTYSVATDYPNVSSEWNANESLGVGYVFSVVLENGTAESVIYFDSVEYINVDTSWEAPDTEIPAPETVPVPDRAAADVLSLFSSAYPAATTFNIGYWGQSTSAEPKSIAGQDVYWLRAFNYLGWELYSDIDVSDYQYMHVDFWTANATGFGFTPITKKGTATEKSIVMPNVAVGEWNSYDVPLSDWTAAGLDLSTVFQIKFDQGSTVNDCYIANVYFYKSESTGGDDGDDDGDDDDDDDPATGEGNGLTYYGSFTGVFPNAWLDGTPESSRGDTDFTANWNATWNKDMTVTINITLSPYNVVGLVPQLFENGVYLANFGGANGEYTYTTSKTYNEGDQPKFAFFAAYAGGNTDQYIMDYTVGDANEYVATSISATLDNINVEEESADITFNYTVSDDLVGQIVTIKLVDANGEAPTFDRTTFTPESTDGTQTIEVSGLTALTAYSYTLTISASIEDETYTSAPVAVTFTTLGTEQGNEATYKADLRGTLSYNPAEGEPVDYDYYIVYAITWNKDLTITVNATMKFSGEVPGMVNPELWYDGKNVVLTPVESLSTLATEYTVTKNYTATPDWTFSNLDGNTAYNMYFRFVYTGNAATTEPFSYVPGSDDDKTSGVENIRVDANEGAVEYFDINGMRISDPAPGQVVIRRQGSQVTKMIIR